MKIVNLAKVPVAALLFAALSAGICPAQEKQQEKPAAAEAKPAETRAALAANPKDVESLEAIVAAIYNVISGPAGDRDWNRLRSLFIPEARMTAVHKNADGTFSAVSLSVDGYIERAGKYFREKAFYEAEASRKVEQFGQEAHVFSTYESREAPGAKPFTRGINSIQLFNDGKRWWCVGIYWDAERPDNPIPERYLTK